MEQQENNDFVQNSYILIIGYLIGSIISTIGSVIVIRLISIEEYSLINIAYIIPGILIPFGELGLNYASTNFIAKKMKNNDMKGVRNVIKITLIVKVVVGFIFTISVAFFSFYIAKYIYNVSDERIILLIQISAIAIITSILYDTLNSIFLGAQKVRFVQIGAIVLTIVRTTFSILLVLMGFTLLGPILGIIISSTVVVIMYLFLLKFNFKKQTKEKEHIEWMELKKMVKYGYPLLIFSVVAGIHGQIFYLILSIYGYSNAVSYLNIAIVSAGIIGILAKALSYTLFPIFSKLDWNNEDERPLLINYFQFSIKFGTLLVIPVTIFVIIFAQDIFPMIYGEDYRAAAPIISVYFIMFLLTSVGFLSIPAFFNSQNQTKYVFFTQVIYLSSSMFFGLILINIWGSLGLVIGMITGCIISVLYGNIVIRKKFDKVLFSNLKNIIAIFLTAVITGIIIYFIHSAITIMIPIEGVFITVLILVFSFLIYYFLFLFCIGFFSLITNSEIDFLVSSFQRFPIFDRIIIIIAKIEKMIIKIGIGKK